MPRTTDATDIQDTATATSCSKQLCDLPQEMLQRILSYIDEATGIILVNDNGTEYELLSGKRTELSKVCKNFNRAVHSLGTSESARSGLPKTHVYKGGFEYFFKLSGNDVQTRIDRLAHAHDAKPVTEHFGLESFYPHGWGTDRYEDFVNSSKNDISVLVIPTAHASTKGVSDDEDRAFSLRHAEAACIGLREVRHWARYVDDGRLLPNLTRIVVPTDRAWQLSQVEGDIEKVNTRARPSGMPHTDPTRLLEHLATNVANRLNARRGLHLARGDDRESDRKRRIIVSTTFTNPPVDDEYAPLDPWTWMPDSDTGSD